MECRGTTYGTNPYAYCLTQEIYVQKSSATGRLPRWGGESPCRRSSKPEEGMIEQMDAMRREKREIERKWTKV